MKRVFTTLLVLAALCLAMQSPSNAIEKRDFSLEMALGVDQPLSEGNGYLSPILYASYMHYFEGTNTYGEIGATTVTAYLKYGYDNGKLHLGIQPIFGHSVYGSYRAYDQGFNDEARCLEGFYGGANLYVKKKWAKTFSTDLTYKPAYHFFSDQFDVPTINKPNNHWSHTGTLEVILKDVEEKEVMGIIKHGFMVKAQYDIMKRMGYGTFDEGPLATANGGLREPSNLDLSHKFFLFLGAYYNFSGDYNIKLDAIGGYHIDTDRNNAEEMGYLHSDRVAIPGYLNTEFVHDKFIAANIQFGIPLGFWGTRISPGFNMLYMPEDNKVLGVQDYPKRIYTSASLAIFIKIADMIPCFINYGYAINAEHRDASSGALSTGSHEFSVVLVAAFFDTGAKKDDEAVGTDTADTTDQPVAAD
ncbi:MAG: hypothetical protein GY754_46625 [bacterium]|nr:hypothetical protein [bacterium]